MDAQHVQLLEKSLAQFAEAAASYGDGDHLTSFAEGAASKGDGGDLTSFAEGTGADGGVGRLVPCQGEGQAGGGHL